MTILRKRKPYTCRHMVDVSVAGISARKVCSAILGDLDGDICKPCAAAISAAKASFLDAPIARPGAAGAGETLDQLIERRSGLPPIWPVDHTVSCPQCGSRAIDVDNLCVDCRFDLSRTAEFYAELDAAHADSLPQETGDER